MFGFLYSNLKKGVKQVTNNPQLIYTVIVAILITVAFIFTTQRFVSIANDSQERLIQVQTGSLQDAFVSFASDKIDDGEYLNKKIESIISTNETIKNFKVLAKKIITDPDTGVISQSYIVVASSNKEEIGKTDEESSLLFTIASSDPRHSVSIELKNGKERLFQTIRAITDNIGNPIGAVITTQTLSQADMKISKDITNSNIILFCVIILVMILFFRHSKIIDYMDLYKKLKEVDQLKDDFISMASHELRTPLSIIRGYADFMKDAPELSLETKDYVTKIDISAKELDSLVADILDVSRIEQGRMSFKFERINPRGLLDQIVSSLEIPAKEKGLNIHFNKEKTEDNQFINIDIGRLKQIFVNLIGNAVKYTMKGEVVITQYQEDDRLFIRISDTGIGMSEEERVKLFEKFYRIKNKDTENIRGTGLGLWITSQMIIQMGGKLSVESIKGVGSHFIVSFPVIS